jgi:hypothetical protein
MGVEEAQARDEVATALEEAIEDGRLTPGSRGFRRLQAQVADAALLGPWSGGAGFSRFDAVRAERFKRWLERGHTLGSAERVATLERVAGVVAADPRPVERGAASAALALWLLERAEDGIALTQTGALNRALVRQVAEGWPEWWRGEEYGPPSGEGDVKPLVELHRLLRRLRLVRRTGRRIVVTARGAQAARRPAGAAGGTRMRAARRPQFPRRVRRARRRRDARRCPDRLLLRHHRSRLACGHRRRLAPARHAPGHAGRLARDPRLRVQAEAIGVLAYDRRWSRLPPDPFVLTDPGRTALTAALHARALAPATRPG